MAQTDRANPRDRFRTPASVTEWHLTRRILRSRAGKPEDGETADTLVQAFRLELPRVAAGDRAKTTPGGKGAS
jgi:hypothetical protein